MVSESTPLDPATRDLFAAMGSGDTEAATRALTQGASLRAVNEKQNTPLIAAMIACDTEMMRVLLAAGADPNQRVAGNLPPLILAAKMHIPALYALGGGEVAGDEPAEPCIRILAAAGADVKTQGPEAAMYAVSSQAVTTLEALDAAGLDWAAVYTEVEQPAPLIDLLLAQATSRPGIGTAVIDFCLRHGAKTNRTRGGQSHLLTLVSKANMDFPAFAKLVDAGADLEATDAQGRTALMLTAALGHDPAFALLVEKGADPWRQDPAGCCALHWAAAHGHHNVLQCGARLGLDQHALPVARVDREAIAFDNLAGSSFALRSAGTPGFFHVAATGADGDSVQASLVNRFCNYRAPQGPFLVLHSLAAALTPLRPTDPWAKPSPFSLRKSESMVLVLAGVETTPDLIRQPAPSDYEPQPVLAAVAVCRTLDEARACQMAIPARAYVAQLETILMLDEGYPLPHASIELKDDNLSLSS